VSAGSVSARMEKVASVPRVSDAWQGKGLGTLLMRHLIDVARQRGIKRMFSIDMAGNPGMRNFAASLGFDRKMDHEYPGGVIHTLDL
jgi:GNAT superfamily N-acetyltransferase